MRSPAGSRIAESVFTFSRSPILQFSGSPVLPTSLTRLLCDPFLVTMALFDSLEKIKKDRRGMRRRRFLSITIAGVACYYGFRWWRFRPQPVSQRETEFLTPVEDFFSVSYKLGYRPRLDIDDYRLSILGPSRSREISYSELRALPSREEPRCLVCIENRVGGEAIGNALWRGTPLRPILDEIVDPDQGEWHVTFFGLDGFYSSVPLEVARDPDTLLAYEMAGAPLPVRHGYPVRVLLPDKYGMKQPRWLERIVITTDDESGYWEKRGWSDFCQIQMTARINSCRPTSRGVWLVQGIAFCGARPVASVEVSTDEGISWKLATLTNPPTPNSWCPWKLLWKPAERGTHILTARVTDSTGRKQVESYSGNYPSGSTGLHRVYVEIS